MQNYIYYCKDNHKKCFLNKRSYIEVINIQLKMKRLKNEMTLHSFETGGLVGWKVYAEVSLHVEYCLIGK